MVVLKEYTFLYLLILFNLTLFSFFFFSEFSESFFKKMMHVEVRSALVSNIWFQHIFSCSNIGQVPILIVCLTGEDMQLSGREAS